MKNITSEDIVDFYHRAMPRKIWEVDKNILAQLKYIQDPDGYYLWSPEPNYPNMPGTFFGIPISIAKDKCFQLRFQFADNNFHIIKMKGYE